MLHLGKTFCRELPRSSAPRSNDCATRSTGSPCSEAPSAIIRFKQLISNLKHYEKIVQEQNSDEQEVIPLDMLAVSYNNEWSSKVEKRPKDLLLLFAKMNITNYDYLFAGDIKTRKSSFCKRSSSAFYFSLPDDVRKMSAKHPANLAVPSQLGNLPTWHCQLPSQPLVFLFTLINCWLGAKRKLT